MERGPPQPNSGDPLTPAPHAEDDAWGFGLYLASSDKYEDQILPTGGFTGTPEAALDCACELYLDAPDF